MKRLMMIMVITILILWVGVPALGCIGTRNLSMGHTGITSTFDGNSSYWNPASLVYCGESVSYGVIDTTKDYTIGISFKGFGFCEDYEAGDRLYYVCSFGLSLSDNFSIGFGILDDYWFYNHEEYQSLVIGFLSKNDYINYGFLLQDINFRPSITLHTLDYSLVLTVEGYDLFNFFDNRKVGIGAEINGKWLSLELGYQKYDTMFVNPMYSIGLSINLGHVKINMSQEMNSTISWDASITLSL